jgi:hypothetical protein
MKLDCTSLPYRFYGSSRGHTYDHPNAKRGDFYVPLHPIFIPIIGVNIETTDNLASLSQVTS